MSGDYGILDHDGVLQMNSFYKTLGCLLLILLVVCRADTRSVTTANPSLPEAIDWENPPQGLFYEDWYECSLNGQKAGYVHLTMRRENNRIVTDTKTKIRLGRGITAIKIDGRETYLETLDGKPLEFSTRSQMSNDPATSLTGTIRDGVATVTTTGPGFSDTRTHSIGEDAVMNWGSMRLMSRSDRQKGEEFSYSIYLPSVQTQAAFDAKTTVEGEMLVDYLGTEMSLTHFKSMLSFANMELKMDSWSTRAGRNLIVEVGMPGMVQKMIRVDEETALADFTPPEVFVSSLLPLDESIRPDAKKVQFRVRYKDRSKAVELPSSSNQSVSLVPAGNETVVTVTQTTPSAVGEVAVQLAETELQASLKPNLYINHEHQAVRELVSQIDFSGDSKPWDMAVTLSEFVNRHISDKNFSIAFASAGEVAVNREGDCSEHAVLLAALGRAKDIPVRLAFGLVYIPRFEEHTDVMGYHMWNQFYLDGKWVDFDASSSNPRAHPGRIAFSYSNLENDSLVESSFQVMETFGNLHIEVVTVE